MRGPLETQDANLVAGMQWLQSTFANRFNRTVRDHGHVFQGRYKALLIEDGGSLLRVVNYIHLNPVRAGLLTVENLKHHPLSSFPKFFTKRRPECLHKWRLAGVGWQSQTYRGRHALLSQVSGSHG